MTWHPVEIGLCITEIRSSFKYRRRYIIRYCNVSKARYRCLLRNREPDFKSIWIFQPGSPRFVTLRDTMIRRHICYRNGLQCSTNSAMEETEHIDHTTISPHSTCNGVSVLNRLKRTEHIPTGVNCSFEICIMSTHCAQNVAMRPTATMKRMEATTGNKINILSKLNIFVLSNSYEYEYEFIPWANYMVPMLLCVIPEDKLHTYYNDVTWTLRTSQISGNSNVCSTASSGESQRKHQAPCYWPLWGEFTGDRCIPLIKD